MSFRAAGTAAIDDVRWRPARSAIRLQFFCLGLSLGSWGVLIPAVKSTYGLDDAALSWVLLALAGGAVAALVVAGRLVGGLGTRRASRLGGLVMALSLALVFSTRSMAMLVGLLMLAGAASSLFDVAINTEGSWLESAGGRKVMSGFHAMFSLGGMAAALLAAVLVRAEVSPAVHLAAVCSAVALAMWGAAGWMGEAVGTSSTAPVDAHAAGPSASRFGLPRGPLLLLGLLGGVGLLAEGAMYDWSVLYLRESLAAPPAVAALAFASFSAAMAAGRFGGDWLRTHVAPARLLAGSALMAALAMALVLWVGHPWVALAGFAVVGAGMANVVPILFVAASQVRGVAPSSAIATVSAMAYIGFLAGPPLVGAVSHRFSLTAGLATVVLASLLLAWGARRLQAP